jgi:hypothetical protein
MSSVNGISRPPSATNCWVTTAGAAAAIAVMLNGIQNGTPVPLLMVLCALALAAPIVLVDVLIYRVYARPSAGLSQRQNTPLSQRLPRVAVKLLGLYATLAAIAFAYWLFPEYRGDFFKPFYALAKPALPFIVVFAIPYFFLVDRRMANPHDGYWHIGRLILGRLPATPEARTLCKEHVLGWIIKAFFLPLMTVFFYKNLTWFAANPVDAALADFRVGVHWWISLAFFLDVSFAMVGYTLTLRVFDSHIRSSNPLLLGWGVAIMCYPPFWSLFDSHYFAYGNPPNWQAWLADSPTLHALWGSVIVVLIFIYAWATVAFGLRFSNLTHRGILTGGPYRFTKHPAYVAKNIFWWLVAVPFISDAGFWEGLRTSILLLLVNAIYFMRARTEEKHLASDPTYRNYAAWIEQHGIFRWVGRLFSR